MPISKADSRFYNWEVQRSQQTRSQGQMMQQKIKDAFKESSILKLFYCFIVASRFQSSHLKRKT